jgi:hypothetical protein
MEILSWALIIQEIRSKTCPLSICFRSLSFQIPLFASKYVIIAMESESELVKIMNTQISEDDEESVLLPGNG